MNEVTQILEKAKRGDRLAAEKLLPLVYEELRKLAAARLAHERPGQTLQATALVHDAYLRLVDGKNSQSWDSRGTSLPRRPRRCAASWLKTRDENDRSRRAAP
jgi:hypothetical protein